MEIDQLPVEILMKIFSYLPRYDNVSLVNRHFYNVVCKVNDSNICLSLASFDDLELLQSINNTNRKITKVSLTIRKSVSETEMRTAISIIKKFSATIKYLKLKASLQVPEFLEILSLVPNAEHLVFEQYKPPSEFQAEHCIMLSNEHLNLHQLKQLTFLRYNVEFTAVLNRLPVGVLTELEICDESIINTAEMHGLLKRQSNIKKLSLPRCQWRTVDPDIFDSLKLESLEWQHPYIEHNSNIATILSKQTKLKSLKFREEVDEALLNSMTSKLTELETLSMLVFRTLPAAIENIRKFKNLKDLMLGCCRQHLESFAKLNNSRITTLRLMYISDGPVDVMGALAKSVPNLKVFKIGCNPSYKLLRAIMTNFNFVEVLQLSVTYGNFDNANTSDLIQADCLNVKLIEFNFKYLMDYNTPLLEQLIAAYPNLKKLAIESRTPIAVPQLKLILKGFTKLESLSLCKGASELTVEDLVCLKDYKNNLKFISLGDFGYTDGREKELGAVFDVLSSNSSTLNMAVGRNTLKLERESGLSILQLIEA